MQSDSSEELHDALVEGALDLQLSSQISCKVSVQDGQNLLLVAGVVGIQELLEERWNLALQERRQGLVGHSVSWEDLESLSQFRSTCN